MSSPAIATNQDRELLAELRKLEALAAVQNPSEETVRTAAEALRVLLQEGVLQTAAALRGLALSFQVPDSRPLVRDARNGHINMFNVAGIDAFGTPITATWLGRAAWVGKDFDKAGRVPVKLETFLKQPVGFCEGTLVTREDVIGYVAAPDTLVEKKRDTIEQWRARMQLYIENGAAMVLFHPPGKTEASRSFRYEPAMMDAAYLEFLACIHFVLASPEVQALRASIAAA
jgi:hypothetical protein